MKNIPHEYIVKTNYPPEFHKVFEDLVRYIQTTPDGFNARFFKRTYKYIKYGDYYYWTMGSPVQETIIINRARIEDYSLKQDIETGEFYMEVKK